ncbi:hypothetical protein ACIGXI_01955 [Kitasatospora aureofaciens]
MTTKTCFPAAGLSSHSFFALPGASVLWGAVAPALGAAAYGVRRASTRN